MKVITVLGTRPEIIKLSPLLPLLDKEFNHLLIHTGQHYDYTMDKVFFDDLQLRQPDYALNVGSHSHGKQTGLMLMKVEEVLLKEQPQLVVVLGDVNSTLAGALAAAKLFIPLLYVEAGCRSFSKELPEEINKRVIPHLATHNIAPDKVCYQHLRQEGIAPENISLLGSTVFDAVERVREFILAEKMTEKVTQKYQLHQGNYAVVTIHRAENTDKKARLQGLLTALNEIAERLPLILPLHPRTRKRMNEYGLGVSPAITLVEPVGYREFLALLAGCRFCLSDSGGIQEEALVFNVPCLILRKETEWTRLVTAGKNFLVGTEPQDIIPPAANLLEDENLQKIKQIQYPYETGVAEKIIQLIKSANFLLSKKFARPEDGGPV